MGKRETGAKMRLDKLLAMLGEGTRTQVRDMVRAGRVTVDGAVVRDAGLQVNAESRESAARRLPSRRSMQAKTR